MINFKLKVIFIILSAVIFSFIFIFLAFIVPLDKQETGKILPKNKLEYISESLKK